MRGNNAEIGYSNEPQPDKHYLTRESTSDKQPRKTTKQRRGIQMTLSKTKKAPMSVVVTGRVQGPTKLSLVLKPTTVERQGGREAAHLKDEGETGRKIGRQRPESGGGGGSRSRGAA